MRPTGPLRTCLGCRQGRPRAVLVRLVRDTRGVVVADLAGRLPGRGAYVCPDPGCLTRAVDRARLSRALRARCEPAPGLAETVLATGAPVRRATGSGEMSETLAGVAGATRRR